MPQADVFSEVADLGQAIRSVAAERCPMCQTPGVVTFSGLSDRFFGVPGSWNSRTCPNAKCGLVWLDPMPIAEDIPKLYVNYLTHTENASIGLGELLFRSVLPYNLGYPAKNRGPLMRLLGRLVSWCGPLNEELGGKIMWLPACKKGRLLDVGCGNGSLIDRARTWGWEATGVEPDPVSSDLARRRGFEVVSGSIEDACFPDSSFDVVTMSHVVEHLPDPRKTLAECRRILKTGGWLVLATPNTDSMGRNRFHRNWLGLDVPRHLMLFNSQCMRSLAESIGFRVRVLTTKARLAYLSWSLAQALARTAALPGLHAPVAYWRIPFGVAFHWREYRASRKSPAGEELFVVAEK